MPRVRTLLFVGLMRGAHRNDDTMPKPSSLSYMKKALQCSCQILADRHAAPRECVLVEVVRCFVCFFFFCLSPPLLFSFPIISVRRCCVPLPPLQRYRRFSAPVRPHPRPVWCQYAAGEACPTTHPFRSRRPRPWLRAMNNGRRFAKRREPPLHPAGRCVRMMINRFRCH